MTPSTFSGSFKQHPIPKWINAPVQVSSVSQASVRLLGLKLMKKTSSKPEHFFGKYFELVIGSGQISSVISKLLHPGSICDYLTSAVRWGFLACSVQLEGCSCWRIIAACQPILAACCRSALLFCLHKGNFFNNLRWKTSLEIPEVGKNRFTKVFGLGVFSSVLKTTAVKVYWGNVREPCHFISLF